MRWLLSSYLLFPRLLTTTINQVRPQLDNLLDQMSGYNGGGGYNNGGGYRQGGYGGGKRIRDDEDEGRQYVRRRNNDGRVSYHPNQRRDGHQVASQETAKRLFRERVWNLGNEGADDPVDGLSPLASSIQNTFARDKETVLSAFRVAVTELPHKLPYYAHLIAVLSTNFKPIPTLADRINTEVPSGYSDRVIKKLPSRANLPAKPVVADDVAAVDGAAPISTADTIPATITTEEDGADTEEKETTDDKKVEDGMEVEGSTKPALPEFVNTGREILADLGKAVQEWLDQRKWRNVRYTMWLFAHLSALPSPLVEPSTLLARLTTFANVLEEPGLRASRGDECVKIIVEALLRTGMASTAEAEPLRNAVDLYLTRRKLEKELFGDAETTSQFEDRLDSLVSALSSKDAIRVLPYLPGNLRRAKFEEPVELPEIIIPAELEKEEVMKLVEAPSASAGLKGDEGIGYEGVRVYLRLFEDETVPETYDPSGAVLRSLIFDIINLYEHNRKEASAILMDLPRWLAAGTFKGKGGEESMDEERPQSEWVLEHLIVESVLTSLFAMPKSTLPPAYYHSLLAELCRLSPSTIAPALGKSVRRLYAGLGNEPDAGNPVLDAEGIRRFTEWFSMHLSNFGFAWGWADWADDMSIDSKHPKRVFVQRVIELEVRLSYYDRIKGTIPEAMLDTGVVSEAAPTHHCPYEDDTNPHSAAAAQLIRLIRSKTSSADIETELSGLEQALKADHDMSEEEARAKKLDIAVQMILLVGSRSFSHFLNVLERYLTTLRNLASSASTRLELLNSVASFWQYHRQFHLIVLDKLLQYRLVDASDVISWVFDAGRNGTWSDIDDWSALSTTIKTVQGRVLAAQSRLDGVSAEEETRRAQNGTTDEDVATMETEPTEEINQARSHLASVHLDWAKTIVEITKRFAVLLPESREKDDWETFWLEGWFREFCRQLVEMNAFKSPGVLEGIQEAAAEFEEDGLVTNALEAAREWTNVV